MARPRGSTKPPSYLLHKPTGLAYSTIDGKVKYWPGKHGSAESRDAYGRAASEWFARGGAGDPPPLDSITVAELVARFWKHADTYFGHERRETRKAWVSPIRRLVRLYGDTKVAEFGPLRLKAYREAMIGADREWKYGEPKKLSRNYINACVAKMTQLFSWGVGEELVPPSVADGLKHVKSLRRGRSAARETEDVGAVDDAIVERTLPHLTPPVRAMVDVQRLTGMRPGEVCRLRPVDIDMTGEVWRFEPEKHKTEYIGKARTVYIGRRAQEIIRPRLPANVTEYIFRPADGYHSHYRAHRERLYAAVLQVHAEHPKQPMCAAAHRRFGELSGQSPGTYPKWHARVKNGRTSPDTWCRGTRSRFSAHYSTGAYNHAVRDACKRNNIPHWHVHQLRHSGAERFEEEYGYEVTRILLGHSSLSTTRIYAKGNHRKAIDAVAKIG
jgi:integrase